MTPDPYSDETPVDEARFVVLDSETTGLDPRRDKLITIGAVAVCAGEILLEDSFEVMIRLAYNNSSVTVHGITRDEASGGMEEREAIAQFLEYLGGSVIVGHHIGHDVETFNAGYQRHFGFRMPNASLDTMSLTLLLERDGAFAGRPTIQDFSLDALCVLFNIIPHDRHTAPGDAFMTALVFQRLLRLAAKHRRNTLSFLLEPFEPVVR